MQAFAWIQSHPLAYPVLEVLHILGIAALLGSLLLFELRVLGRGASLPLPAFARLALGTSLGGFALVAASGLTMFASQAGELIANRAFVVKMALLLGAGLNAAAFHARGGVARLDAIARWQTGLSLGLWLAIVVCGRWIAYI